jgi:dolichol-phosphate mannosyltransferase
MSHHVDISIIVSVKDEEESIPLLAGEIDAAMEKTTFLWECLWVDDGSTDRTLSEIKQLHEANPHHQYLSLTRNFGQSAAMAAGFANTSGSMFVTLDGDGQNDPSDIPPLINRLISDKADMVNGRRKKREDSIVRKISSRIANGFRNRMTKENVKDVGCSLRAIRKECVQQVPVFKGMHRFLPTLIRMGGYNRIVELPVNHRPRERGKTKYGIQNRLWVGLADTFAVRWMQHRLVFPKVKENSRNANKEEMP